MNGTAVRGERVVIVEVDRGNVNLRTGRIAGADPPEEREADATQTVVRGDRRFHPVIDSPEEAYEKAFPVGDIHLLKAEEAQSLRDPGTAQAWFGSVYQDWVVARIHRALKRLKLSA
jgi:hypothetical protein